MDDIKIMQIVAVGMEDDSHIYGLSDKGVLYVWQDSIPGSAYSKSRGSRIYTTGPAYADTVAHWTSHGDEVVYSDGSTAGWLELGSGAPKPIINPLDPSRHERS